MLNSIYFIYTFLHAIDALQVGQYCHRCRDNIGVEFYSNFMSVYLIKLCISADSGKLQHTAVSVAKRNNVKMALEVARMCRNLLGGNGIIDEYAAMRHMCNLESVFTYEGTDNIHTLIVGQALTGLAAFSG